LIVRGRPIVGAVWIAGLLAIAPPEACAAGAASPAAKAEGAREELRELKSRIEAIQKRIAAAEESKSEAADALQASERAISDANRAVSELDERSRNANTRVAELKREIGRAHAEVDKQRSALARLLYQQYVAGRPEALAVLLNGRDPNAAARELQYLSWIGRARSELIAKLTANVSRLEQLAAEAGSKAVELAAITAEHARQRQKLEQEKRARAQVLVRISRAIEQQRREIGTLRRDEARLARLIEQLGKLVARAPRPRTAPEPRVSPGPRLHNDRLPEPVPGPEVAFAQLRGRLSLPVRGELANRFGSPRQDGGLVWRGLFIAARAGEEVRAIAAGRVVYADWLRGFGNLLIIDHGDSYMSLYGYNETLYKQVGDAARAGERIAAVGNSGGHGDSGLYFEMRHEGRPFDPMTWVTRR
jgi:septal ring factor EnvC (AmiA/AmiB activator)